MRLKQTLLALILLFPTALWAECIKVTSTSSLSADAIAAGYTAANWAGACDTCSGNIGLPSVISINNGSAFQPAGTLLASAVGSFPTAASDSPYMPNQILFRCAAEDAGSLYEMYATNGSSTYSGKNISHEVEGAYYDAARNVAVRMTNLSTGEYYSRYWKSRQLSASSWYSDGTYIYIPASAFSNVLYEMFKIDSIEYYVNGTRYYVDTWAQPRGYIAFKGPGLLAESLGDGQDSASNWSGWNSAEWPGAWSTYKSVTYVRGALCEVKDYPSVVRLPLITVGELAEGNSSQTPFSVSVRCEAEASSGTLPSSEFVSSVAMGFLVNQPNAVTQATRLGLVNSGGGLTWLLDTRYGSSGVASGVGIKIYDAKGRALNLLPDLSSTGTGNSRGWYGYKELTSQVSSGTGNIYSGDFIASLEAINGQTITAGAVNAQLQVVVSFQ
ncbi:fimbrial protein [Candidatus Pantoea alvi]|nr:fimbrial protein [Pantoea alvi]